MYTGTHAFYWHGSAQLVPVALRIDSVHGVQEWNFAEIIIDQNLYMYGICTAAIPGYEYRTGIPYFCESDS